MSGSGDTRFEAPAGETFRAAQDASTGAKPVTGQQPVGMAPPFFQIEKGISGAAIIHMDGRPLCLVRPEDAAELDKLLATIAALPMPPHRAAAVSQATVAAFSMGVMAGQSALMFGDEIAVGREAGRS